MHFKSTLTAAAIALVAGLGAASAADQFATLEGVPADPIPPAMMERVLGAGSVMVGADLPDPAALVQDSPFHPGLPGAKVLIIPGANFHSGPPDPSGGPPDGVQASRVDLSPIQ